MKAWTIRQELVDSAVITEAVRRIDTTLARAPYDEGLQLKEGLYRITVSPLTAFYGIQDAERIVEVANVRWAYSGELQ